MNKKTKIKIYWLAIIIVAISDSFSSSISAIPVLGALLSVVSNTIWEITELALIFGLVHVIKPK